MWVTGGRLRSDGLSLLFRCEGWCLGAKKCCLRPCCGDAASQPMGPPSRRGLRLTDSARIVVFLPFVVLGWLVGRAGGWVVTGHLAAQLVD